MFKFICSLTFSLCLYNLNAQLRPQGQVMLDSMNRWMQIELQTKGTIDTAKLAKFNAAIRETEAENKKATPASAPIEGGKVITKELIAGAMLTVPEGVEWRVQHLYLKDDKSGYRIVMKSDSFQKNYHSGEKLRAPGYPAELALIDESDGITATYIFEILEIQR